MIRPGVLLMVGLLFALGCGRADRPTVRQTSMSSQDESGADKASKSTQAAEDVHAGLSLPKRNRPKRDFHAQPKPADAVHAKPTDAIDSRRPEKKPAETGDAKTPKADTKPAKTSLAAAAKNVTAKAAKTGDATTPKAADHDHAATINSKDVRIGNMCLVAPKSWMRERPPIRFILAQFSLPRAAGDKADAQLTVTSPGEHDPRAVARVREQLKEKPDEGSVEHLQIAGNEVVLVDSTGDYGDDSDDEDKSSPPAAAQGRYRALNAMVFLGNKVYIVNCTGPEKTVTERASEFRAFLQTMKAADKP